LGDGELGGDEMGLRGASLAIALVALAGLGGGVASAVPASASAHSDPTFKIDFIVKATTHIAKLNQNITVPPGKFVGVLDLVTGNLVGNLTLPPAQTTVSLAGIGLATAGFAVAPVGPVKGHVDLSKLTLSATSVFNAKIPYIHPLGLPINLVGSSCETAKPISITFTGKVNFSGSTFSSSYTIPNFQNCGLTTPAINLLIPGPGNTFTAKFSPAPA
jgi:hypothetical protein